MGLIRIVNELVVENVCDSIKFYENNFNFKVEMTDGNPINWVQLRKDDVIIMLESYDILNMSIDKFPNKTNSSNLIKFEYETTDEIIDVYNCFKYNNMEFFMDYTETNYGKIEFGIFDLDRNMILISALMKK